MRFAAQHLPLPFLRRQRTKKNRCRYEASSKGLTSTNAKGGNGEKDRNTKESIKKVVSEESTGKSNKIHKSPVVATINTTARDGNPRTQIQPPFQQHLS